MTHYTVLFKPRDGVYYGCGVQCVDGKVFNAGPQLVRYHGITESAFLTLARKQGWIVKPFE
jgi:hypothetical protein